MLQVSFSWLVLTTFIFQKSISLGQGNIYARDITPHDDSKDKAYTKHDSNGRSDGIRDDEDWQTYRERKLNEALIRLNNATSIEDIIASGLLNSRGRPLTAEDLSPGLGSRGEKLPISEKIQLAIPDDCSPRETSLPINSSWVPADSLIHPKCIKVLRCGGCCNGPNLKCTPVKTRTFTVHLNKLKFSSEDGEVHWDGLIPMEVVEHTQCRWTCALSEKICGPNKIFNSRACTCSCKPDFSRQACAPPRIFNPETCQCECAERRTCCIHGRECPLTFNEDICQCDLGKMHISSSASQRNRLGETHSDGHSGLQNKSRSGSSSVQTLTTSPERARIANLAVDPCVTIVCPLGFVARVNARGNCVCSSRWSLLTKIGR